MGYAEDFGGRFLVVGLHPVWYHPRGSDGRRMDGAAVYQCVALCVPYGSSLLHSAADGYSHYCLLEGKEENAQTDFGLPDDDTGGV